MAISTVTIDSVTASASTVTVEWTATGLVFSGGTTISGFVEVVSGELNPSVVASTEIDEFQAQNTASYTTGVNVSDVPPGDYSVRVNWEGDGGNSGMPSTPVTIPEEGSSGDVGDDTLTIGELTTSCSVSSRSASPGDQISVEVEINGVSPAGTTYNVGVDLFTNGQFVTAGTGEITPNGASGAEFTITLPEAGDYDIGYELRNLRRVSG